jgi:hypothetical protein
VDPIKICRGEVQPAQPDHWGATYVQWIRSSRRHIVGQMDLRCAECLLPADDEARGCRLLRVDVPGEDAEPQLAAFCPGCAEREFGPRRVASNQAGSF